MGFIMNKVNLLIDNLQKEINEKKNINGFEIKYAVLYKRFLSYIIDFCIINIILISCMVLFYKKDFKIIENSVKDVKQEQSIERIDSPIIINDKINQETINIKIEDIEKNSNMNIINQYRIELATKMSKSRPLQLFLILFPLLYYYLNLKLNGRTLGQKYCNLSVISIKNGKLTNNEIFHRVFLFYLLNNFIFYIFTFIIPFYFTKNKLALYDICSNTRVIEVNKIK